MLESVKIAEEFHTPIMFENTITTIQCTDFFAKRHTCVFNTVIQGSLNGTIVFHYNQMETNVLIWLDN